ncbi:hypothetical protein Q5P01_024591 [Channa striata]|uniref:Uncharacterized protein n=1 Tax=Channa striata TaxID=64152 RepID=A0AA88J827_CHASR|nr:hypothetical protein Q5P01_024591 [Channa striata]
MLKQKGFMQEKENSDHASQRSHQQEEENLGDILTPSVTPELPRYALQCRWAPLSGLDPDTLTFPGGAPIQLHTVPPALLLRIPLFYVCTRCGKCDFYRLDIPLQRHTCSPSPGPKDWTAGSSRLVWHRLPRVSELHLQGSNTTPHSRAETRTDCTEDTDRATRWISSVFVATDPSICHRRPGHMSSDI